MSLLLELLGKVFAGVVELFGIDRVVSPATAKGKLWVARLAAVSIAGVAAVMVWTVTSPLRWVGAVAGLLAVVYGLYVERHYR